MLCQGWSQHRLNEMSKLVADINPMARHAAIHAGEPTIGMALYRLAILDAWEATSGKW
jgi:hypothetical protein